jgi:tRNA dimethylallyltransferase
VPREELVARIEARTERMFEAGVEAEVCRALEHPLSETARMIHGLRDIAELPRDEAIASYNRRVRRYAAYQRKWMRRIPGIVIIDAHRPAEEVAAEILEVASARERVPGDGARGTDAGSGSGIRR